MQKDRGKRIYDASIRITNDLCETGYITEKDRIWIIDRIKRGDKTAYDDVRHMLIEIAKELACT